MGESLTITLTPMQLAWVNARKEEEGFSSSGDVIRELIRREQEKEWAVLAAEFERLNNGSGGEPEPVEEINRIVRQVKKERREAPRRS